MKQSVSHLFVVVVAAVTACADKSDVGNACPMSGASEEASGSAAAVNYPTVVEVNALFPCASLTCVATMGRSPYCTAECRDDSMCPDAFECRVVVSKDSDLENSAGFSGRQYCVWRGCSMRLECGDPARYDCIAGNYGPEEPSGLCGPAED